MDHDGEAKSLPLRLLCRSIKTHGGIVVRRIQLSDNTYVDETIDQRPPSEQGYRLPVPDFDAGQNLSGCGVGLRSHCGLREACGRFLGRRLEAGAVIP